jgi:hypothetical protein
MGLRLILLKASVVMGELSVRMVVPMAMKKLYNVLAQVGQFAVSHAYPKVAADPIIY